MCPLAEHAPPRYVFCLSCVLVRARLIYEPLPGELDGREQYAERFFRGTSARDWLFFA